MKKSKRTLKQEAIARLRERYELPSDIHPTRYGIGKSFNSFMYLKGMLWTVFARFVRARDTGLLPESFYVGNPRYRGVCITCLRPLNYEGSQAGHYAPAGGTSIELQFKEENVNAECPTCNADFQGWHLVPMRKNLVGKYGEAVVMHIDHTKESQRAVKWWESELAEKIHHYYRIIKNI